MEATSNAGVWAANDAKETSPPKNRSKNTLREPLETLVPIHFLLRPGFDQFATARSTFSIVRIPAEVLTPPHAAQSNATPNVLLNDIRFTAHTSLLVNYRSL